MKYGIFKGLLFCCVVMGSMDTEGMVEQQLSTANLGTQMEPRTRPVTVNEFVPSPKRPVGIEHIQESFDLDLRLKNSNEMIMEEENTTIQQSSTSSEGDVEAAASEAQSYNSPIRSGDELMEEESIGVQQSPASLSTSSDEQAQYPTSMTFSAKNIEKFYNLSEENAKNLTSVTFKGVNIDQNFVSQFKCLFRCGGLERMRFDACNLQDNEEYNNLFNSSYCVVNLTINDKNLTNDDAIVVYCSLNQLEIGAVCFSGQNLDRKFIMKELSLCDADPRECLSINE